MSLELMAEKSDFVNIIIRRDFGPDSGHLNTLMRGRLCGFS